MINPFRNCYGLNNDPFCDTNPSFLWEGIWIFLPQINECCIYAYPCIRLWMSRYQICILSSLRMCYLQNTLLPEKSRIRNLHDIFQILFYIDFSINKKQDVEFLYFISYQISHWCISVHTVIIIPIKPWGFFIITERYMKVHSYNVLGKNLPVTAQQMVICLQGCLLRVAGQGFSKFIPLCSRMKWQKNCHS